MQKVFEIIKGVGLYINFYKWKKKRERKNWNKKGDIYVWKEKNKRKIVSESDRMACKPHPIAFPLPLLVLSGEDKSEREVEKGTLETDYVSEIFDSRKGKSRIILGEDYRL